ncbi:hypothetical protein KM043_006728 [Ampulex compressa]|nr:hypothetical protein KM043_006728 [Ampulex compressa]
MKVKRMRNNIHSTTAVRKSTIDDGERSQNIEMKRRTRATILVPKVSRRSNKTSTPPNDYTDTVSSKRRPAEMVLIPDDAMPGKKPTKLAQELPVKPRALAVDTCQAWSATRKNVGTANNTRLQIRM